MSSSAQEVADAVVAALDARRNVTDEEHAKHHLYIDLLIKREERRTEFWHELGRHVAKWGAISVLTAVFYGLWLVLQMKLGASPTP